jgi:hypothetical protein
VLLIGIQSAMMASVIELSLLTAISTVSLSLVGGWFGGALFPPVIKFNRRRAIDTFT